MQRKRRSLRKSREREIRKLNNKCNNMVYYQQKMTKMMISRRFLIILSRNFTTSIWSNRDQKAKRLKQVQNLATRI
jgi:hypothetical protein